MAERMRRQPVTLSIAGEWADAWLYKEHLLVWDRSNNVHVIAVERVLRELTRNYGSTTSTIAEYSLFRNDWKRGAPFASLSRIPAVQQAIDAAARELPEVLQLNADSLGLFRPATEPASGTLLDTAMYGNRVFLASNHGLFQTRFNPKFPDSRHHQAQLLEFPVHSVRAKYMSMNASAYERGLWFKQIEWGEEGPVEASERPREVDDYSEKTQFIYRDLLNYGASRAPQMLRADVERERPHENAEFADWKVRGYQPPVDLRDAVLVDASRSIAPERIPDPGELTILNNSYRQLLISQHGILHVVPIGADAGGMKVGKPARSGERHASDLRGLDLLETHPFGKGFLIETMNDVRYVDLSGSRVVFHGPVARVRTFGDSIRYREVAAVIHRTGLDLLGAFSSREFGAAGVKETSDLPAF